MSSEKRMRCEVMTITPEMARRWIKATGDRNFRKPDLNKVSVIAKDIVEGRWQLNGESIGLDGEIVRNGFHRLCACVLAGLPIESVVVHGIPEEANDSIDRGKARTLAQWLAFYKVPGAKHCSTVTRNWHAYREGQWKWQSFAKPSQGILIEFFREHEKRILNAVRLTSRVSPGGLKPTQIIPLSLLGALACEGSYEYFKLSSHCETVQAYLEQLSCGESLTEGSPVIHLRNRMLGDRQGSSHLSPAMRRCLAVYAWNLLVQGESTNLLRYRLTGPAAQVFPAIQQATI